MVEGVVLMSRCCCRCGYCCCHCSALSGLREWKVFMIREDGGREEGRA
jgi:hypothetical protein